MRDASVHVVSSVVAAAKNGSVGPIAPGLVCFLIVVALGLALWVLLRSMNRHLGKVSNSADEEPPVPSAPGADSTKVTSR
jgi:hypothetical protein